MNFNTIFRIGASCLFAMFAFGFVAAETIFQDTFVDGDAADAVSVTWVPVLGSSAVVATDFVQTGAGPRIALAPEYVLGATSIRARIRADENVGVCLGVRRTPGPNGYSGCLTSDGTLDFIRVDGSPAPITLGATTVPLNVADEDVMLQVDAIGDELSIWAWSLQEPMPEVPQLVISDATHATGSVGLISAAVGGALPATAIYRSVHVADTHTHTSGPDFDCNGDGVVEGVDLDCASASGDVAQFDAILHEIGSLFGDLDFDGSVGFSDFLKFSTNFNVGTKYGDGDLDWNGTVDFADFLVFSGEFGKSVSEGQSNVVPEPVSITLLWAGACFLSLARRLYSAVARQE